MRQCFSCLPCFLKFFPNFSLKSRVITSIILLPIWLNASASEFNNSDGENEYTTVAYRGNNFVVMTNTSKPAGMDLNTEGKFPGANYITLDHKELQFLTRRFQVPITPIFAINALLANYKRKISIFGIKENQVWRCELERGMLNLKELGQLIDINDKRLLEFSKAIVGSKLRLAYENTKGLIAILEANDFLYSTKKLEDSSFSIQQLGPTLAHN